MRPCPRQRPDSFDSNHVVVFGASGGIGREVVEQALGRGHEIVAAVRGADAVITALGPSLDRADIATFLLDRLDGTCFIRAAPAISN